MNFSILINKNGNVCEELPIHLERFCCNMFNPNSTQPFPGKDEVICNVKSHSWNIAGQLKISQEGNF